MQSVKVNLANRVPGCRQCPHRALPEGRIEAALGRVGVDDQDIHSAHPPPDAPADMPDLAIPGGLEPPNILIRSQVLYPVELRDRLGRLVAQAGGAIKRQCVQAPRLLVAKFSA